MATALKDIPFKSEFPTINEQGAFVDLKIGTPCDCEAYAQIIFNNCDYTPFGQGILYINNQNCCGNSVAVMHAMEA